MPTIRSSTMIDLTDFMDDDGFGDGDDRVAINAGYEWRNEAIEILNRHLAASGLGWEASQYDPSTMHNACRISLRSESQDTFLDGFEERFGWAAYDDPAKQITHWPDDDAGCEIFRTQVWPAASAEFNQLIEESESDFEGDLASLKSTLRALYRKQGSDAYVEAIRKIGQELKTAIQEQPQEAEMILDDLSDKK